MTDPSLCDAEQDKSAEENGRIDVCLSFIA